MLGVTFWVPTHAPNHLVTHFESVSAFLLYPAPGYPGRDLPLESYLSQRRLWGGRGTSRVRLPYTGVVAMALKPPFSPLYYCSLVIQGLGPSHNVAPSMVFPTHGQLGSSAVVTLPLCHSILATPSWAAPYLGDALLGDALPGRRLTLATLYVDFDLDFVNARVRDGTTAIHVEGLTAPLPYLRVFPCVCPPSWECNCARGDFLGANSCPQASSHSL